MYPCHYWEANSPDKSLTKNDIQSGGMYFHVRPEKALKKKKEGGVQTHKNGAKHIFLAWQSLILTLVQTHLPATACGLQLPAHHELNCTTVYGFTIADRNVIKQFQTKKQKKNLQTGYSVLTNVPRPKEKRKDYRQ